MKVLVEEIYTHDFHVSIVNFETILNWNIQKWHIQEGICFKKKKIQEGKIEMFTCPVELRSSEHMQKNSCF